MRKKRFQVWRTITVGVHASLQDDINALEAVGMVLSAPVYYLFSAIGQVRSSCRVELDLVRPTVSEIGFTSSAMYTEVFERGVDWGLELTPWEGAIDGRRKYADQPLKEVVPFAMKPFFGRNREPCTLVVEHQEGFQSTLGSISVVPKARIAPHRRVIFVQPRI